MATFGNNPNIVTNVLIMYDKVMVLKLFVDSQDETLQNMYQQAAMNHNNKILNTTEHIDAGFDLFAPQNTGDEYDTWGEQLRFFGTGWTDTLPVNKLDFKVSCSAKMYLDSGKQYNTGYYMYPRSSLSKTQLRLANATGIIDSGYRGHLIGAFDIVNRPINTPNNIEADYYGRTYDRYLQICAPGLVPIIVEIVSSHSDLGDETERGGGGFGSTGR